jgi:hypothetical protein
MVTKEDKGTAIPTLLIISILPKVSKLQLQN